MIKFLESFFKLFKYPRTVNNTHPKKIKAPNKNIHYQVKNVHGTGKKRYRKTKCTCDNWLAHWKNNTKSKRTTCAILECARKATVGAHVICVDERMSNKWYIVPFCKYHNHYTKKDTWFLDSRVDLVPLYELDSCKRTT